MYRHVVSAAALTAALTLAPAVHADNWHRGGHGGYYHHGGGAAVGAGIIGGIVGLGVGAAIANQYYAPPPVYYGYPSGYYAPPPAVYYGY